MSKIKNGGLDQCGTEPFKQQQFGTAGVERVNVCRVSCFIKAVIGIPESARRPADERCATTDELEWIGGASILAGCNAAPDRGARDADGRARKSSSEHCKFHEYNDC